MGDDLVMERFRLLERIGSGGMGTVYRAFDERLQRQVAVKEVEAEPARVMREAQAAARLNHPAVVTLYELGERDGRAVLVSELVPGETLAELRREGLLSDRDVAEVGADVCEGLAHAHDRGVVHRDVKPENVIVRDDAAGGRRAKLMDFGIARVSGASTLTAAGEVVGSLAYMSPEQAEGESAGPPTDVYSVALTLYECWAGVNPVAGSTPAETARRIGAPIQALHERRADLPERLADTVDACLDPDPDLRPSPRELCDCLEAELDRLDDAVLLPATSGPRRRPRRARLAAGRILLLTATASVLALLAGPIGLPGAALALAALALPSLIVAAPLAALAPLAAPLLAQVGIPNAATALGTAGPTPVARALLGATSWAWMFAAWVVIGAGPDLGIAERAPSDWAASASAAAESVLAPLVGWESLLGAAVFALAAVALGWVLSARHAAVALLGAMLWAAATDAAVSLVGDGDLGGRPLAVAAAAALAVVLEYGPRRARAGDHPRPADPVHGRGVARRRLSGRLV